MEDKPKGGAPPSEPEKPKTTSELRPVFSFHDLIFEDAFTSDNRKFLRFFVTAEIPFYIDVLKIEWSQYFDLYTDLFDKQMAEDKCTCDSCSPSFDNVGDSESIYMILDENKEEQEISEKFPIFYIYDLPQALKVGIHQNHDLEDVKD